jgi:hypothetical protein
VSPSSPAGDSQSEEIDAVPDNAACSTCQYSELTAPSADLKRARLCRRFPPVVITVPTLNRQGQLVGFAFNTMQPIVAEDHWCFEYDVRDGTEIEPTGLLVPGN